MPGKETAPSFEPDDLGWRLAAAPAPRLHAAFGEGYRYALGADPESPVADVEVYPDAMLIRYSADGFQITIKGETVSGRYENDDVIFEARTKTAQRTVRINRFGDTLAINTILDIPVIETHDREPPAEPPAPQIDLPEPKANDHVQNEEKEKQERVALVGRAGRDPKLQQTAKGVAIAKFPLAVHDEGEKAATWHTIVAFNRLAREIAETVKKGNEYKVVGYKHERIHKDKLVAEVYAAVVKARSAPTTSPSPAAPLATRPRQERP